MDKCFAVCGCDDLEGITKSDLDRFTDKIENVLNDEKGRRLFRNYMYSSNMRHGRKALDFYENIDRLLNSTEDDQTASFRRYLRELDRLIDAAERIQELDLAMMERMVIARDNENKEEIIEVLKALKLEVAKTLKREYSKFRERFIPSKHN